MQGDDTALRAQRVIEQIVANDHRAPLSEAERARGINQLLLDGVSPTKVAKGLSTTKEAVAAARVAVDSEKTMTALDAGQLTLVEATRFVEFDGDDESQAELIKVAGTDQFEHRVAQLRAEREDRRRYAEAAQAYAAKGYTVLDERPGWSDKTRIPAYNLKDAEGQALTDQRIAEMDPQHWAVWFDSSEAYIDTVTGEPVEEDSIDFDTADDASMEPAEGYRHFQTVSEVTAWQPNYFCCDLAGAGVTMPEWLARQHGVDLDEVTDASDPDGAAQRERARHAVTKNYLRFLDENSYPLSEVEQVVIGKRKADALYRQISKDAHS